MNGNDTRNVWLWAAIAFVIGLAIGLGVFAWQYSTTQRQIAVAKRELESTVASLTAENQKLASQARTAEASAAAMSAGGGAKTTGAGTGNGTSAAPPVATGTVKILSRSATPESVTSNAKNVLTLTMTVQGVASNAKMRLVSAGYDKIWDLAQGPTDNGITTWSRTIDAPAPKGTYHYYALAYVGDKKFTMPGVSGFTFTVK